MSLYDKYFSKTNKNYIFSILQELIIKETNYNINENEDYINLYRIKYPLIFERASTDNLIDLNKTLIDEIGILLIKDINSKRIDSKNKDNIKNELYINSSERLNTSINRYNYDIKLKEFIKEIRVEEINIPEENNIIFDNILINLCITTNNKNHIIAFKLKEKIKLNNKIYNTYYPLQNNKINCDDKLKIEIKNNDFKTDKKIDKLSIKKIKNITYKNKNYLCILMKERHNLDKNISVGIYCKDKLTNIFSIDDVTDFCLLIENEKIDYYKENEYYLLDMNSQNNILLSYS